MSLVELLILLLVAGICGSIGQAIAGSTRGGIGVAIALGFIGALLGTWIARQMHLPDLYVLRVGGVNLPVVWSIVGATIFVAVLTFIGRR